MDTSTYDKAKKYKPGHGYEARVNAPTSIVVHSTSNPHVTNTPFTAEATFLLDAPLVSSHYLIGKDGAVVRFLDPRTWAAWHAGNARPPWANARSIGVELHHSVGDPPYPDAQLDALAVLLRSLMGLFAIPLEMIETHGQIALPGPYLRKTDPSDMSHEMFLTFRSTRVSLPPLRDFWHVRGVPIYQAQSRTGLIAGYLTPADTVEVGKRYEDGGVWLADGRGFIDGNCLEPV